MAEDARLRKELRDTIERKGKKEKLYSWMLEKEHSDQTLQINLQQQSTPSVRTVSKDPQEKRHSPEEVQKTSLKQKKEQMKEYYEKLKRELQFLEEGVS
eukprot:8327187-Ditylum_brightwellii.AAC.1